jgi:hypothetical protein
MNNNETYTQTVMQRERKHINKLHELHLRDECVCVRRGGEGDIFPWGGRVFNLYTAMHIHIRDYIYYCALTATFLIGN